MIGEASTTNPTKHGIAISIVSRIVWLILFCICVRFWKPRQQSAPGLPMRQDHLPWQRNVDQSVVLSSINPLWNDVIIQRNSLGCHDLGKQRQVNNLIDIVNCRTEQDLERSLKEVLLKSAGIHPCVWCDLFASAAP